MGTSQLQHLNPQRSTIACPPTLVRPAAAPSSPRISTTWARHLDEVREAQRLRHAVFAGEMGARLTPRIPGHDVDLFDD